MSRYQKHFIGVILLVVIAVAAVIWKPLHYGLDIVGGMRVTMQVDPQRPSDWPSSQQDRMIKMESIRKTITTRVGGMQGVVEPRVVIQGDNRLVVELPGVKNQREALRQIEQTASLDFYYLKDVQNSNNPMGQWRLENQSDESSDQRSFLFVGPRGETIDSNKQWRDVLSQVVKADKNPPIVAGKDLLSNAKAGMNQNKIVVNIQFNSEGTKAFREFTSRHLDDYLAIFFDNKLIMAPTIQSAILDGKAEITGMRSLQGAKSFADLLNSGALPVPMKVIAKDSVEPTLGRETVHQVIVAGIIGLLLVVLFMAIYYRLPGVIACIALVLYSLFVIAAFKLVGSSMSLAGIAALIISIGMAVDANILIFERLKEELRGGKTLRAAIDAGFGRAFTAIFDSNMCTAITCAILMSFGTASVQNFGFTLLIGVAISMFTAITVTRTILHMLIGWGWAQNPNRYGLNTGWLRSLKADIVGKRAYYFLLSAILIIPGLITLALFGLKPGIEFKAGTTLQATFKQKVAQSDLMAVVNQYAPENEIQLSQGGKSAFIKTTMITEQKDFQNKVDAMLAALNDKFGIDRRNPQGEVTFDSVASVGPTISRELTTQALKAVFVASILIVLYLWGRFAIGGFMAGLKFGVCAVIALIHDACFILGLFAILGKTLGWEVDSLFVTAVLTIIGFSVHDTIVVFDRIRENLRHRLRGESFEQLCNRSILQTIARSINTSFTVVMTLVALIILGGPLLRHFYVALAAGIIIGTYSSIFNATPLVIVWEKLGQKAAEPARKTADEKPLIEKPMVSPGAPDTSFGESGVAGTDTESEAAKAARIKRRTAKKKRF